MVQADYFFLKIESKKDFITDEGILHNYSDVINKISPQLSNCFFENRMVIYCRPNLNFIMNNIKQREKENKMIPYHKGLTLGQIEALTIKSFNNKDKLIEILKQHKVPVLLINTELEINQCLREIDNWIRLNTK
jgi:hypothetical protein